MTCCRVVLANAYTVHLTIRCTVAQCMTNGCVCVSGWLIDSVVINGFALVITSPVQQDPIAWPFVSRTHGLLSEFAYAADWLGWW